MPNPASETAVGPMTIVAAEKYWPEEQQLVHDDLAYHFLPTGVKWIVRLAAWRPARNLLVSVTEKTARGVYAGVLCRKRYIEETMRAAIGEMDSIVILGAGLDTLAYRVAELLAGTPVFEVDLPENIAYKRGRLLDLYGRVPDPVRLVPIDFESQNLESVLDDHGYRAGGRAFFVWEAVTQYLTEDAIRNTFDFLAKAAPGSRLVFTYVRQDFLDGLNLYGAETAYERFRVKQELWHFGMEPEQVPAFLEQYGWRAIEQMGGREFRARYIQPTGRALPVSDLEMTVSAVKS